MPDGVLVKHDLGRVPTGREHGLLRLAHLELALRELVTHGEGGFLEGVVTAFEGDEVVAAEGGGVVGRAVDELRVVLREDGLTLAVEHAVVFGSHAGGFVLRCVSWVRRGGKEVGTDLRVVVFVR